MPALNIAVMFLHIGAGIIWVGTLIYLRVLLLPVLNAAPPTVRGPVVMELGPKQVRVLLRLAELTIVTGFANIFLMGRIQKMSDFYTTAWGWSIGLGMAGAIVIYVIGQAVTAPVTHRIAAVLRSISSGQAGPEAAAAIPSLAAKQLKALNVQVVLGVLVVLTMAVARFS